MQTCMELFDKLIQCGFSTGAAADIINDLHTDEQIEALRSFLRILELVDNDRREYV